MERASPPAGPTALQSGCDGNSRAAIPKAAIVNDKIRTPGAKHPRQHKFARKIRKRLIEEMKLPLSKRRTTQKRSQKTEEESLCLEFVKPSVPKGRRA
jgi:hypothetical protein